MSVKPVSPQLRFECINAKSPSECVGQIGAGGARRKFDPSRIRTRVDGRDRARAAAGGACRHVDFRSHEVSGNDGRARQNAASTGARRHSGAAKPCRRPRCRRRARHHADRSCRRQFVPVRAGGVESECAVRCFDRRDRHRRSKPGARGCQELRGCSRGGLAE